MKVIEPGHIYTLNRLDGEGVESLVFVKREGEKYPGNVGHHTGTNMQEVLRALIDRVQYVNKQIPHWRNMQVIGALRDALRQLETRAAERHGRRLQYKGPNWEKQETCSQCGHIECKGECR